MHFQSEDKEIFTYLSNSDTTHLTHRVTLSDVQLITPKVKSKVKSHIKIPCINKKNQIKTKIEYVKKTTQSCSNSEIDRYTFNK